MKAIYSLFILTILICCITSCGKTENAVPAKVAAPVSKDSANATTATTTIVVTYPHVDTFTGIYYDTVIQCDAGDWGSITPMVVQSPFVFYVVYPNASQVVFMNDTAINWLGSPDKP